MFRNLLKKHKINESVNLQAFLANERTLLAWVRTGLALIAGGVAITFTISSSGTLGAVAGIGSIIFGGIIAIIGYRRYQVFDHAIRNGYRPRVNVISLLIVVLVIVVAALLLSIDHIA